MPAAVLQLISSRLGATEGVFLKNMLYVGKIYISEFSPNNLEYQLIDGMTRLGE